MPSGHAQTSALLATIFTCDSVIQPVKLGHSLSFFLRPMYDDFHVPHWWYMMVRGYVLELQPQTDFDAWLNFTHLGRGSNVNSVTEVDMLRSLDYKPWAFLSCFSWMKLLHLHNVKLLKSSSRHAGEFAGDTINTILRVVKLAILTLSHSSAVQPRAEHMTFR